VGHLNSTFDAVILAGGAARRFGGTDKPGALLHGRPLITWVADAVADAGRLIVVGPPRAELPTALTVREDPPGGGPVPALRAGLGLAEAGWTALLAADLPFLRASDIARLLAAAKPADGAVLVDGDGREQWLTGVWRTPVLRRALGAYQGASLRGLLNPLDLVRVPVSGPWFDCDTLDDVTRAGNLLA
jgi:molybdenum cofactor guanylyltransferase